MDHTLKRSKDTIDARPTKEFFIEMLVKDIDLIEVNEAFASVVAMWQREIEPDMTKVNVQGGAIALGHPLGATGAKLMVTLVHALERTGGRLGMQTMCCGGGLGIATIVERLAD